MKKVVLYIKELAIIGGLETFVYNFCTHMGKEYDLTLAVNIIPQPLRERLSTVVKIETQNVRITCDTLVMLRMTDTIPTNISYNKVVRRIHSCKYYDIQTVPTDGDVTVCVSNACKNSFGLTDAKVIYNPSNVTAQQTLLLVSATRLPAPDKGDNVGRMRKLGKMLDESNIPYMWLNFSNNQMDDAPKNFYNMGFRYDVQNYMQKADYVVQLSTIESFGNTVLEALSLNVPVICTPVPSFFEIGVKDKVNAHVVPFDMNFDVHELLNVPKFGFLYNNKQIVEQWKEVL